MPTLKDVMTEFAARHAAPSPQADQTTGGYALAIDGRYITRLYEQGGQIAVSLWLADLPTGKGAREESVRRALRAELALLGEDEAVLSLDEATQELRLHRLEERSRLDVNRLQSLLRSLIDGVERRRAILGSRPDAPPLAPPDAPLVIRP